MITDLRVFPQPAISYVTIEGLTKNCTNMCVFDIQGKKVRNLNRMSNSSITISRDNLNAGTYFLVFVANAAWNKIHGVIVNQFQAVSLKSVGRKLADWHLIKLLVISNFRCLYKSYIQTSPGDWGAMLERQGGWCGMAPVVGPY